MRKLITMKTTMQQFKEWLIENHKKMTIEEILLSIDLKFKKIEKEQIINAYRTSPIKRDGIEHWAIIYDDKDAERYYKENYTN